MLQAKKSPGSALTLQGTIGQPDLIQWARIYICSRFVSSLERDKMNASFKFASTDYPKCKPDDFTFSYSRQRQIREAVRKLVRSGIISRSDAYVANTIIECHTFHKTGVCRPTDDELMDSLACSKSTITRAIAALEAAGVLQRRKVGYSSDHAIEWAEVDQNGDFIALKTKSSKSSNLTNSKSSDLATSKSSDMTNTKKGLRGYRERNESVGPVPDISPTAVASLHSDLSDPHMSSVDVERKGANEDFVIDDLRRREAVAISRGTIKAMMPSGYVFDPETIEQIVALHAKKLVSNSDARRILMESRGARHG